MMLGAPCPVVEKSTGAGILYSVGDRGRLRLPLLYKLLGFKRRILVKQFQGELAPPWIGRVKDEKWNVPTFGGKGYSDEA